ncbi:hypothetical protein, partial [Klebsiella pneumoniae]|uniref:hypothetical protein n=1 Tax=Klebsiella pneumoniae TaxID=573 RepID=UPI002731BA69
GLFFGFGCIFFGVCCGWVSGVLFLCSVRHESKVLIKKILKILIKSTEHIQILNKKRDKNKKPQRTA